MKKATRIITLAISITFLSALCACGQSPETKTENRVTRSEFYYSEADYSAADEYLRANGYPESFIANTGNQTKQALFQAKAVFDTQSTGMPSAPSEGAAEGWGGFSGAITVSDASVKGDNLSKKFVTFNWAWTAEREPKDDFISLSWNKEYSLSTGDSMFELHGEGDLENSFIPSEASVSELPKTETGSFLFLQGHKDKIQQTVTGCSMAVQLPAAGGSMLRKYFSSSQESSSSIPYGDYLIDTADYRGSFTIVLIRHAAAPVIGSATGGYSQKVGSGAENYLYSGAIGVAFEDFVS